MRRIVNFGVVLFLISGHALRAASPEDVSFRARLVNSAHAYHMGESIEIEISYSSPIKKKYYGSFSYGGYPQYDSVVPHVTPSDGLVDMRELIRGEIVAGHVLYGGPTDVGSSPVIKRFDLSEWYRFQRSGRYSLTVTSREVWRKKSKEEGGGDEDLTLESSPVDLEILPADPVWVAGELSTIKQGLRTARDHGARQLLADRLARLDTPASVQVAVPLYLSSTENLDEWMFHRGVSESSQIHVIIPLLEAGLSDPAINTPVSLPELLADLQTRKELGVVPANPGDQDPAAQQKWTEEIQVRSNVRAKYLAQANARLVASIDRRSGPQRVAAIYQAWYEATQLNACRALSKPWRCESTENAPQPWVPVELARLQSAVLAVAKDLSPGRQQACVTRAWPTMPHEQLLPLIRRLAADRDTHAAVSFDAGVFSQWCEGWRQECDAAILQDVLKSNANVDEHVILLLPEAEHPEFDAMLEAKLKNPAMLDDSLQSQRTAVVILRAGSRSIAPAVDSFLDRTQRSCNGEEWGETWGDLIGYLFRVEPETGAKRLSEVLQAKDNPCGWKVLGTLNSVRPSEDLIPIVTQALYSPNLIVARSAAVYVGRSLPRAARTCVR